MARMAFLGGTGEEGLGLALRFAMAGEDVIIGSRSRERAEDAARKLRDLLRMADASARVDALDNAAAVAASDVVTIAFPYEGIEPLLTRLQPAFDGKMVLDVVNPLVLRRGMFDVLPVPAGSAGELIQQMLPRSPVVSGFKNLSAKELLDPRHPLRGDVLLCGNVPEAVRYFVELIARIPSLRAVDAGSLASSRHLEVLTALLLNLNRRHKAITSIEVLGLGVPGA
jgi:NADPH-dependent F420 reductase